jgi:DNA-binding NarL/FixJ family response regulator
VGFTLGDKMMINVVIVEDQDEIRKSLCILINGSDGFRCIKSFADAESAMKEIPQLLPDVALVDIHLPGASGIDCITAIKPLCPNTQFLICTVFEDADNIYKALKAGANGYLLKNTPPTKLLESIGEIFHGGSPMSSQIARKVINAFQNLQLSKPSMPDSLTMREKELLQYLSKGYRYKEIADKLFISHETVKTHIRNIYEKLQVQSKVEALNKVGMI